jgi:aryl-alcohol dehydrogenase-like predicted oxidoreductase
MKYRKLGNSGVVVSTLSLGSMQFGQGMKMGGLDQAQTSTMVRFALERGINLIDTADVYGRGESEALLGNALHGVRDRLVLATKARLPMSDDDMNHSGATRKNLFREVEASLRRLQTDYIDLYQVHGWDSVTPLEETLRTLDDLVRSGKVRYIGLSNYLSWQAATALGVQEREHLAKYITAQMYYSLVGRELEHEFLSFAEYHRLGVLVWSPLAGGFLSGKYDRQRPAVAGTRFADAGRFVPFDVERGYDIVDVVRRVAERHGATPAQIALAWLLLRPTISSVIVAARSNERLEENLRATELTLAPEDVAELDAVSSPGVPYPQWMVTQLDQAEDPRPRVLEPAQPRATDLRGTRWPT